MCEPRSICLGEIDTLGTIYLERVVSAVDLMSIGRQLQLCVAHDDYIGREYHRRLRRDDSVEFWCLRARAPLALLEVARGGVDDRSMIVEYDSASGPEARLPRSVLARVARELDASGDEVEAFERVGAFWALRRPSAAYSYP